MTTGKKVFIGIIVLIAAFWVWYLFIRISKKKAISIISKKTSADPDTLANFGEDYLIARAKAIRSNNPTFELNGKNYSSATGKAI